MKMASKKSGKPRMSKQQRAERKKREEKEKKEKILFRTEITSLVQKHDKEEIRAQAFLAKIYELVQKYAQPYNFCVVCAKDKACTQVVCAKDNLSTQPFRFSVCKECRQKHSDNSKEQPKGYLNFPKLIEEGFKIRSDYDRSLKLITCIETTRDQRLNACREFPKCDSRTEVPCKICNQYIQKINRSQDRL